MAVAAEAEAAKHTVRAAGAGPARVADVSARLTALKAAFTAGPALSTGLMSLCRKKQAIRQIKSPDSYGARSAIWYRRRQSI